MAILEEDRPLSGAAVRERIPLMMPSLPTADELLPYLRRIDAARWYSNFGPLVSEFESRIAASFSTAAGPCRIVSVSSCTAGIELALRALALPAGAPILVPALTFIATASAVRCAGLSPVVADVDPHSWLLTPEIARAAVRTIGARAVIPVTTFGAEQDGAAWSAFARDTGVPVIIDAAAGYGNQRDPGPTCAVFSLHATKPLAAGEGGFVVTRDAGLAHAIRRLTNFGINLDRPADGPIGTAVATGTNAKLSEYHAAVALASLDGWRAIAAERNALYARSVRAAQSACGGRLGQQSAPEDTVRGVCPYLFPDRATRDRAEEACRARGIGTRRWYLPTIDRQPAFGHVAHLPTPNADAIGERLLGVPFYPGLAAGAIDEIASALGSAFG
jgi:dTDP-4-amino-4,6-dideoxygalactose transaminase